MDDHSNVTTSTTREERPFQGSFLAFLGWLTMLWLLASFVAFVRPFGDGLLASLNALPVVCTLGATLACLRISGQRAPTRAEVVVEDSPPPAPAPGLLAKIIVGLVLLGLVVVIVPGLSGLGMVALRLLATLGQQSAAPGAMPAEQLLVPATDGFVRLSQWLILPGLAISVMCAWRFARRSQQTAEVGASG